MALCGGGSRIASGFPFATRGRVASDGELQRVLHRGQSRINVFFFKGYREGVWGVVILDAGSGVENRLDAVQMCGLCKRKVHGCVCVVAS